MKVAITGAHGLLGWHAACHLHAANCAARFRGETAPYDIARLDHPGFDDDARLAQALAGADIVLHFAGINRADDDALENGNIAIAERLIGALGGTPAVIYANSTHAERDTPYGRGKNGAAKRLREWATTADAPFTDLVLPHVFGECGRANYNNVTGTLCAAAARGEMPDINPDGRVELVHAGAVAEAALDLARARHNAPYRVEGRHIDVPQLWDRISDLHLAYDANIFPGLSDPFTLALFNTYRVHRYPDHLPGPLKLNTDPRGTLFEAAKGGGGGQTFLSWTEPGVTRGDHFHINKVERFLVVDGEAIIRIRRVLGGPVWEYRVTGLRPTPIDMPTLHTHSIENVGTRRLLTMFWSHEIFDPAAPDTYADPVLPC